MNLDHDLSEINDVNDYCRKEGITIDELYVKINQNEDEFNPDEFTESEYGKLPKFIEQIVYDANIKGEGKELFMIKFGVKYLKNEIFRRITDGCVFIFRGKNYYKVFPNISLAFQDVLDNPQDQSKHIIRMYPDIVYE